MNKTITPRFAFKEKRTGNFTMIKDGIVVGRFTEEEDRNNAVEKYGGKYGN